MLGGYASDGIATEREWPKNMADAPDGFLNYCDRYPARKECIGSREASDTTSLAVSMKLLDDVNRHLNSQIKYQKDIERHGLSERWNVAVDIGDCEDFALAKLQELLKRGVSIRDIVLATCWDERGGYHTVLLVRFKDEWMSLDNRKFNVVSYKLTGYKFHKRQSEGGSQIWVFFQ